MSERNTSFLLSDIKESIENIFSFTDNITFEIYSEDIKTVHAVQHNFMIIGEAVARISEGYKQENIIRDDRPVLLISIAALISE